MGVNTVTQHSTARGHIADMCCVGCWKGFWSPVASQLDCCTASICMQQTSSGAAAVPAACTRYSNVPLWHSYADTDHLKPLAMACCLPVEPRRRVTSHLKLLMDVSAPIAMHVASSCRPGLSCGPVGSLVHWHTLTLHGTKCCLQPVQADTSTP
jgi:hypothetical protein